MNTFFLIGLLLAVSILAYQIFAPFMVAIFLAFVFSHLFKSWYGKFLYISAGSKTLASLLTCFLIFLVLIIPVVAVSAIVFSEVNQGFQALRNNHFSAQIETIGNNKFLQQIFGLDSKKIQNFLSFSEISESVKSVGNFFFQILKATYQGTSHFIFMTVVMFFSLYYFFKDGAKFEKKLFEISPLKNSQEKILLERFVTVTRATLNGTLVIGIIQGLLLGLLFWIVGIPSPAIWGLVTVIISIIPMIGAIIIWLPAGLILLLIGNVWQGVLVLAFGALIVSTVDNFLRPKLVEGQTSLHPLLVFFSTIGGLAVFGISGFIIGPVIVVLLLTLLDIYKLEFKQELQKFNK